MPETMEAWEHSILNLDQPATPAATFCNADGSKLQNKRPPFAEVSCFWA